MFSDPTIRQYGYLWIAVVMACVRIVGHKSEVFQAFAHLFVGMLLASGWTEYRFTWATGGHGAMAKVYIASAVSLVELGCFVVGLFT